MMIHPLRLVTLLALGAGIAHADATSIANLEPNTTTASLEPSPTHESTEAPRDAVPEVKPRKRPRPYVTHANFGMMAMNWQAATADKPSTMTTIADRQTVLQMVGFGRFITPTLRVMLSMQLAEVAGGAPPGSPTLAMVGIVPWLGWHPAGPLFFGAGPVIAPRIYGKNQLDLGVFTSAGVVFPLGKGFSAGTAVQFPIMLRVKTAVSVAPAAFVAYRF